MHVKVLDVPQARTYKPSSAPVPAARLIALYLPQFHPISENDLWWGRGFTEWTNVAKALPLFRGHYQPHIPAHLGFYDLRLPETREAQAALARAAGIEGFCYWHYWFAGKRILERPFQEVLRLGEPDFPFCLGWANQSWTGIWHGAPNRILIKQTYPGRADYEKHFHALLRAFHDPRYIRVRGKPIFVIFRPGELPCPAEFIELWQTLAERNGLQGIHFIAHVLANDQPYDYRSNGFAGAVAADSFQVSALDVWKRALTFYKSRNQQQSLVYSVFLKPRALVRAIYLKGQKHLQEYLSKPSVFEYSEAMIHFLDNVSPDAGSYPCVVPNWDNSPRSGVRSIVLHNSTPALFGKHVCEALSRVIDRPFEDRLIFVKSWNEWAEGNYLEPDQRFCDQYLDVLRKEIFR